jgi:hypothetical protein
MGRQRPLQIALTQHPSHPQYQREIIDEKVEFVLSETYQEEQVLDGVGFVRRPTMICPKDVPFRLTYGKENYHQLGDF